LNSRDKIKPGILFSAWLVLAGVGRQILEFFRPDQPTFPGTGFSYSRLVALLMIIAGILIILIKYQIIKLKFIPAGRDNYILPKPFEEAKEKSA
jgi:prolipoprotein diacylglyceryltransferase